MATIYQNGIQYSGSGEPLIYDDMGGATSTTGGVHGLVPAPSAGDNEKFLSGDGSWKSIEESVTKTASGNPIEISDSANAPLVKCVTEIQGSQDLHGYDKPWVGGAGKNKLNAQDTTISGGFIFGNVSIALSAGTYTLSFNSTVSGGQYQITIKNSSDSNIAVETGALQQGSNSITFTISETSAKCSLYSNNTSSATYSDLQIETGSSATTYEPYSNICPITAYDEGEIEVSDGDGNTTTHTTTYPSAIYRGSEDVVNGEVTSEWRKIVFDGTEQWALTSYNIFSLAISDIKNPETVADRRTGIVSSLFPVSSGTAIWDSMDDKSMLKNDGKIFIRNTDCATVADFQAFIVGTELAYELATPTTSPVTPTNLPVKSLYGYNHIESSTGEMEIEYITSKYSPITEVASRQISAVEKLLELMITANREEEMKATQNYTAGDLLIVSGKLYKASSNIANGSTLVINSNVTSTTIAAELAALA